MSRINLKVYFATRRSREVITNNAQVTSNKCKQITRFLVWISPVSFVTTVAQVFHFQAVTVGKKDRVFCFISFDGDGIRSHHIRAI
ncbi:hypothetical protein D3C86_1881510 [compost metagenome]